MSAGTGMAVYDCHYRTGFQGDIFGSERPSEAIKKLSWSRDRNRQLQPFRRPHAVSYGQCGCFGANAEEEPPLGYSNSDGKLDGISVDLVRELQQRVGNREQIQVLPWARAYRLARNEADTLLFTTTRTPERTPLFHWLLRVNRNAWILYAHRDHAPVVTVIEDARAVESIGVLRGGAHERMLQSEGFTNLVPMSSYVQLLQNLAKGRLEMVFYSASGFLVSASKAGITPDEFIPLFSLRTPESYIVLSKMGTDTATLNRWRQAAESIQSDGTYERIARRWVERLQRERGFSAHVGDGALNLWPAPE
ncbi:MAG: transporter substrate-binding domain-containing protein [Motiliproteus sp.]